MKKVSIFATALAISVLFLASFAYAAPSKVIPIQGKLTQPSGVPYNGQYSMTFKIFDVATSGTLLYTETLSNIPVSAGLFSIVLGENPSNPLTPAFDKDYYIEITIGSETLQPRQRLLSSPYAISALTSINSTNSQNAINSQFATNALTANTALSAVNATNLVGGNVSGQNIFGNFVGVFDSANPEVEVYNTATNNSGYLSAGNDNLYIGSSSNNPIVILTNNTEKLRVTTDGKVGIGTVPSEKLDVVGNVKVSGNINATRIQAYVGTNTQLQTSYNLAASAIGSDTTYAYNAICVGNSNGQCTGIGGTVITPSNISTTQICLGSDCKTSWPSSFSLPQDIQFNSINTTNGMRIGGNTLITGNLTVLGSTQQAAVTQSNVQGNMFPGVTNAFDLGTGSNQWRNVFASDIIYAKAFVGDGSQLTGIIPNGTVMYFNLASCPSGWSVLTSAQGRYVVGLPSGGTLATSVGTALSNLENRPTGLHNVSITDPGHTHGYQTSYSQTINVCGASCGTVYGQSQHTTDIAYTGIAASAGNITGTNAPYIQLLVCQKNTTGFFNLTNGTIALAPTGGVQGSLIPSSNASFDIGSPSNQWRNGYFSGPIQSNGATLGNNVVVTTTGSVGIGTATPQDLLHINGTGDVGVRVQGTTRSRLNLISNNGSGWQIESAGAAGNSPNGSFGIVQDGVGNRLTILNNGNVGIGTTTPTQKLDVVGTVKATSFQGDGSQLTGIPGVPSGAVMYFDLTSCPSGWSELTSAKGRYVIGLPTGGTLGATVGTNLEPQENRATGLHTHTGTTSAAGDHTHSINDPGHSHTSQGGFGTVYGGGTPYNYVVQTYTTTSTSTTGISINSAGVHSHNLIINNAGSVAGTNAPYLQLLVCKKS